MEPVNPYRPDFDATLPPEQRQAGLSRSIVIQVRVVSILLIIHGGLCLLMGLFLAGMAAFMPTVLAAQANQGRPPQAGPTVVQLQWIMMATYGGMSASALIPGLLQLLAGLANLQLKKRTLGIVALATGMLAVFSCYCLPSSLGLAVYGLVIYLNSSAQQAFALSNEGRSFDEVVQMAN